ncbi:ChbG/HpnK family deacetylase [Micromonospora sp. 067-2]|uniref:ChbG/HpnK family deacetylase n=1 Tax=Micromonospora sp. 067-2 TaxID=2789270 RepID=UPI00397BD498
MNPPGVPLPPAAPPAPARRRLLVRADDAGLCVGVNRAIVETVRNGIVGNVSVMVPAPAFADAARRLSALPPVCVGLHATLTSEWVAPRWRPILPGHEVPSLVDDEGYLPSSTAELHRRTPALPELLAEVEAQLRHARSAGLRVTYLDEHMGFGWLPGVREALVALARREGLVPAEECAVLPEAPEGTPPGPALLHRLAAAPIGTAVLVTHPGLDEPELRAMHERHGRPGEVAVARDAERAALTGPEARRLVAAVGIDLARFTSIHDGAVEPVPAVPGFRTSAPRGDER